MAREADADRDDVELLRAVARRGGPTFDDDGDTHDDGIALLREPSGSPDTTQPEPSPVQETSWCSVLFVAFCVSVLTPLSAATSATANVDGILAFGACDVWIYHRCYGHSS